MTGSFRPPAAGSAGGQDANAVYPLGSSAGESARLRRQADELAPDSAALLDRVGLRPGQSAIDLGCGPRGILDLLAGRTSPGGRVVGLDADPAHAALAAGFAADSGLGDVQIVTADARGFGAGGKVLTAGNGPFTALGLDTAGDIFVLPALAEFSPSGQADAAVTPAAITASSHGGAAAFLPDGQFVLTSSIGVARHDVDIQVQRFNAGGSLASTSPAFDFSGATGLDQARDGASAVAVQADGQAVAAGSHFLATSVFGLGRVNPDGTLDAGFGTGGTLTTAFNGDDGAGAVLVQPDGKIVAAGFSENNTTGEVFIALARYNG